MKCKIEEMLKISSPCEGMRRAAQCIAYYIVKEEDVAAAITERGGGSDPSKVVTRYENGKVYGEKLFVTGADRAKKFLVLAKDAETKDFVLVLVGRDKVDVNPMDLKVYRCAGISRVEFKGSEGEVIASGREAYKKVLDAIAKSRLLISALAYKLAEEIVREGIEFVKSRKLEHQVVKHRVAKAWSYLYVMRNLLNESDDWSEIAAIKLTSVEMAKKVAMLVMESMGGYGLGRVLELYEHILALEPAEGTSDIQLEIISRKLFG